MHTHTFRKDLSLQVLTKAHYLSLSLILIIPQRVILNGTRCHGFTFRLSFLQVLSSSLFIVVYFLFCGFELAVFISVYHLSF